MSEKRDKIGILSLFDLKEIQSAKRKGTGGGKEQRRNRGEYDELVIPSAFNSNVFHFRHLVHKGEREVAAGGGEAEEESVRGFASEQLQGRIAADIPEEPAEGRSRRFAGEKEGGGRGGGTGRV